jgi:catalase
MTHKASNGARKSAQIGEQKVLRGEGGETHQIAGGDVPPLTTQQGVPVADDQNSLKIGSDIIGGFSLSREDLSLRSRTHS